MFARGGANEPESSDEALKYVATGATACTLITPPLGDLREECVKIAVLVTDARAAGCDDFYTAGVDDVAILAAGNAAAAGIFVSSVHVLDGFLEAEAAAGLMGVAAATGGQYVEVPFTGEGVAVAIEDIIASCGTAANECPNSQGFWRTHSDAWPVDELTIGGMPYSKDQLMAVLWAPVRGNAVLILAKQYIAALLNIANGSSPAPIAAELAAADALLSGVNITTASVRTNTATGQSMTSVAGTLDTYNNRYLTPDCDEGGGANSPRDTPKLLYSQRRRGGLRPAAFLICARPMRRPRQVGRPRTAGGHSPHRVHGCRNCSRYGG